MQTESIGVSLHLRWKLALDAANVLLLDLASANLLLHLACLFGIATEKKEAGGQSVKTMDCAKVLESVLFGQNEYDGVVPVSTARMDLKRQK